ncbi:MAG: 6-phosphogluconolactonase [Phycisphaeraceae bacterium]|nr:6-phosphogluconolactonase [Phycisphaeraceae bacterium]
MSSLPDFAAPPPTPKLPGTVVVRETADAVVDSIAADLMIHAMSCVRAFGDFHLALSGGKTPLPLYLRMMYDPAYRAFPWNRTHLWIVDERRVPFDDERSNFKAINEIIGDHSDIPREQVHPIFAMADDADVRYERELQECLAWREKGHDRLDYVLLGMGPDAHTASLFPHSPALVEEPERPRLVRINSGPRVTPPDRVTMTFRLINASRFVSVLAVGPEKQPTFERVVKAVGDAAGPGGREVVQELPILGVRPVGGELRWYLDHAACPAAAPRGT